MKSISRIVFNFLKNIITDNRIAINGSLDKYDYYIAEIFFACEDIYKQEDEYSHSLERIDVFKQFKYIGKEMPLNGLLS